MKSKHLNLVLASLFTVAALATLAALLLRVWTDSRHSDSSFFNGGYEIALLPAPRHVERAEEVVIGLASAFDGGQNPWEAKEALSAKAAAEAWKNSGSKVLLIAHYGTCSYRDAGCQQWSGKSHHGGVYPVLEDLGDRIKTVYREIEERPGFYDVIYLSKADLTEELTQTEDWQRGRDDSSVESSWSNQWSFLGPLPEKFLAKPKKEKSRKLPAGTSA